MELSFKYRYHPDYLGHTEFISDANGDPYQYFWYSPFGDAIVEEHANTASFSSRYLFNAKELDPETGRYYYGARYYDPGLSIWLSVDPLGSEFPNWTPYAFDLNNPINLVDPDGRKVVKPGQPSEEPPISLLGTSGKDGFRDVFNRKNNSSNYQVGDNFFPVYAHGNNMLISDRKSKPRTLIRTAEGLDALLRERSSEYRESQDNGESVTVCLLSCLSATEQEGTSLAKEFSEMNPDEIVIGMDGFTLFPREGTRDEPKILGVSTERVQNGSNNDGEVVIFKDGVELNRLTWDEFAKLYGEYFD